MCALFCEKKKKNITQENNSITRTKGKKKEKGGRGGVGGGGGGGGTGGRGPGGTGGSGVHYPPL